jgi:hypothetical protein
VYEELPAVRVQRVEMVAVKMRGGGRGGVTCDCKCEWHEELVGGVGISEFDVGCGSRHAL